MSKNKMNAFYEGQSSQFSRKKSMFKNKSYKKERWKAWKDEAVMFFGHILTDNLTLKHYIE